MLRFLRGISSSRAAHSGKLGLKGHFAFCEGFLTRRFLCTGPDGTVKAVCSCVRTYGNWDSLTASLHYLEFSGSLVERILLELKEPVDAKCALRFFHWSARDKQIEHSVQSYCIMIQILVHARLLIDAQILLESIVKKYAQDDCFKSLILKSFLNTYVQTNSRPFLFDFLVQAYAKLRMPEMAFRACCYLEEQGFSSSLISFNKLIHVAQKSGQTELVWKVYEHMLVRRTYPNEVTVRIMIDAMCKDGVLQKFLDILDRIHGKRCTPVVVVSTSLIFRILEENRVVDGTLLLKRMLQKNMVLGDVAYSLIIYAHCKTQRLDLVYESHDEMIRRGYHTNSFLYTLFIRLHCDAGKIEEASQLMQKMRNEGLKASDEMYNVLITACSKAGKFNECITWLEEMMGRELLPGFTAFNQMISKLCEVGEAKKANDILTILMDKGFVPDQVTYYHLLGGYDREGNAYEVLKLFHEMQYVFPSPSPFIYTYVIQVLCQCGKFNEAHKLLSARNGKTFDVPMSVYNLLISKHSLTWIARLIG